MATTEKILQLKQDFDDVYEAGYNKGIAQGGGGSSQVDLFPYMTGAPVFQSADLTDITEDITLHFDRTQSLASAFSGAKFSCKKLTVYISEICTNLFRAFRLGSGLEEFEIIGTTSQITNYSATFAGRQTLKRIIGNFDFSSATNVGDMLSSCDALEEFYPVANTIKISISFANCPNLIPESRQAIFDGLATVETAQTLTLHKNLKILQSQVDSANAKGWTIAGGTVVSEEEYYG